MCGFGCLKMKTFVRRPHMQICMLNEGHTLAVCEISLVSHIISKYLWSMWNTTICFQTTVFAPVWHQSLVGVNVFVFFFQVHTRLHCSHSRITCWNENVL